MRRKQEKRSEETRTDLKEAAAELGLLKGEACVSVREKNSLTTGTRIEPENKCPHCGRGNGHKHYGSHLDQLGRMNVYYECVEGCGKKFKIRRMRAT